jgi:plasmid stabilization system protein ParE
MEIVFTEQFLSRLEEYSDYIALRDPSTAVKWSQGVIDRCKTIVNLPTIGRIIPEIDLPTLREIIYGNYRLIYEVDKNRILMLTIWHSRQHM